MVILSSRFEYGLFKEPAHGPVYPPAELDALGGPDIGRFAVSAFAGIGKSPLPVPAGYRGRIAVTG